MEYPYCEGRQVALVVWAGATEPAGSQDTRLPSRSDSLRLSHFLKLILSFLIHQMGIMKYQT